VVVQVHNCDGFLLGGKKVFNAKYAKDSRRAQRKADEHNIHHYRYFFRFSLSVFTS
jgi:hypothetical protein